MVAIAIPASCVGDQSSYSLEQATFTLYQISRACLLFHVEEIVIYSVPLETSQDQAKDEIAPKKIKLDEELAQSKPVSTDSEFSGLIFAANMLQFLITPPHLRKLLFKSIGNPQQFKYAKKFPEIPELKQNKNVLQGIAVQREKKKRSIGKKLSKKDRKDSVHTPYINLGFDRLFKLRNESTVLTNSRVYVDLSTGQAVPENQKANGYSVRAVNSFGQIFTQSPVKGGYSQSFYVPSQHFKTSSPTLPLMHSVDTAHVKGQDGVLLLFGKWSEVQASVSADSELDLSDAAELFDGILQGEQRARVEDSVMITLARS